MTRLPQRSTRQTAEPRYRAAPPNLPLILFVAALVLAYGYEVFSFGLTIDEERYGEWDNATYAARWLEERRWTMSFLTLLVPSPVVPVVSTGLGVALSGTAWWLLSRRHLGLTPWQASLACSLAGTIPVLAFIFSFSTIALGIGIGNCFLVVYMAALSSASWRTRAAGVLAGAAAVGIYDSFLVALGALSLALILKKPNLATMGVAFGAPILSLLVTRVLASMAGLVFNVSPGQYIDRYLDVHSLLSDPAGHIGNAFAAVGKVVVLREETFGLHSPWLALVLGALTAMAITAIVVAAATIREKAIGMAALIGLLLLPVLTGIFASVPLRSMFYFPIITLVLASVAFQGTRALTPSARRVGAVLVGSLVVLSVVGNATISNRLFASAQTAYALDRQLAFVIGQEKDKLLAGDQYVDLAFSVSGVNSWPAGKLTPKAETIGASFFEWDGDDQRMGAFLRMHGVRVHDATAEQSKRAQAEFATMPAYPADGWVRVSDGVLLIKFGDELP